MKKQNIHFTSHAKRRMAQRAVTPDRVRIVLTYAKKIYRQGFVFHVMRDKDIPDSVNARQRGRLKRLVVVTSGGADIVVITVYRSSGALSTILRKSKKLL